MIYINMYIYIYNVYNIYLHINIFIMYKVHAPDYQIELNMKYFQYFRFTDNIDDRAIYKHVNNTKGAIFKD